MPAAFPYVPDDAGITREGIEFLNSIPGRLLREAIARRLDKNGHISIADLEAMRRQAAPALVNAALTVARLQEKARSKFPDLPYVFAVPEALEQASHQAVAQHKAGRFAALQPREIADLCAGIGGDTLALTKIAPVHAVELSPARSACIQANYDSSPPPRHPLHVHTANLIDLMTQSPVLSPQSSVFHIDPSRRSAGKRSPRYEDLIPGPDILAKIIAAFPKGGAIKLSPAVDFTSLPQGHLELISQNRTVVQAVNWMHHLASIFPEQTRTATVLSDRHPPFSYTAPPAEARCFNQPDLSHFALIHEADGAIIRAQLAQPLADSLALASLTPDAGYLAGEKGLSHPALTSFEIIEPVSPYSEKRAIEALKRLAAVMPTGAVEVKTRGGMPQVDTDRLQKSFTDAAPAALTILIFRYHDIPTAIIAKRL